MLLINFVLSGIVLRMIIKNESAAKALRFAQALVSLLSLESSMLIQFGEDEISLFSANQVPQTMEKLAEHK